MATMHKLQVQCKWHTDGWQKITKSGASAPTPIGSLKVEDCNQTSASSW